MNNLHYIDGRWVTTENLKISAFDLSVVRGFGVFDFLRTYNGRPFLLDDHLRRFYNSAKLLGLKVPESKRRVKSIILEGIKKNSPSEMNVRMVLTGGVGPDSLTVGEPSLVVMYTKAVPYPAKFYQKGVKVITFRATRFLARAKSLNYLIAIKALQKAKKEDAVEAIYIDDTKKIYEGTTTNFFSVIGGRLTTTKEGILIGITRRVTLRLAKKLGMQVIERDIRLKDINKFEEAFITASNKEIMPVVKIDDRIVGNGKVGKVTKRLIEEYRELTQSS